ncbi:MAG TPA: hypothetical protein VK986_09765 [Tepidisphaeraceae bacterium]|nr:hypothetical protein [Tepidisphaeraceae bacterium]
MSAGAVAVAAPPGVNQKVRGLPPGLRLTVPPSDAVRLLKGQLERGSAIKRARIRYVPELEQARAAKGDWTARTTNILEQIFNARSVAEEWQAYAGQVLPEYADLNLFIEQFYDEMDQRLRRLGAAIRFVQELPESATPRSIGAASAHPVIAAALPTPGDAPLPAPPGVPANPGPISPEALAAVLDGAMKTVTIDRAEEYPVVAPSPAPAPSPVNASKTMNAVAPSSSVPIRSQARPAPVAPPAPPVESAADVSAAGLLVAHAPHAKAREAIEEFVAKLGFGLEVHDPAAPGAASLADRVEALGQLDFAVVLVDRQATPGDFDLGYCAGRLGHRRVFLLAVDEGHVTADPHGLLRIPLDPAEGWQLHLARQLKRAGLAVDLNRVF